MSIEKYVKRPGDLEIRILTDGRLVFFGPDEEMLSLAELFNTSTDTNDNMLEGRGNGRIKTKESDSSG